MAPRTAQKTRTRAALLTSARRLMADGEELTLARVAEDTGISRATVYRYFSDPGPLAAEATLDFQVTPTSELLQGISDPRKRVHAVARFFLDLSREHDRFFRQFLAKTMEVWQKDSEVELRGARRVAAFAEALDPVRDLMEDAELEELAWRLSMLTGIEQHIVLDDILCVDHATGNRLQSGLVDAVLDRYLP
ncbi:TetR/AcrR family transcriptional regulator [Tropicibacter sp. Alg240-R139]|uniref:TetR/AcrR family transcriptional regulator n=1 Tax=Tropicibacter sp. Alg240-R139 TaxID=2305991 RepID=UPI0013DFA0EF|nr:TetR family transcriptional regulator [Tropicibacter sp. Alg240-R139]